jgi:hypothetical protein
MTQLTREERFRRAAEEEGGMSVSAGLRVGHIVRGVAEGRVFYVDLSRLPEVARPIVMAQINQLVDEAVARTVAKEPGPFGTSADATN